ncbi:YgaP family membrane protein [Cytobacillus sp. FSL H8-0458]|uniref:YgaP family membrane protein n=1 Tax=Cytobacillus sp. FSL H8-0458 TaxID=2975346 RepID=UPI0030F9ACFA
MHVKSNIGIVNALIRITIGFTVLAWSTSKLVKRPWRDSYLVMAMLGGMKVAEGIVRFCPLTALFERGQDMVQEKRGNNNSNDEAVEEILPYNPS